MKECHLSIRVVRSFEVSAPDLVLNPARAVVLRRQSLQNLQSLPWHVAFVAARNNGQQAHVQCAFKFAFSAAEFKQPSRGSPGL